MTVSQTDYQQSHNWNELGRSEKTLWCIYTDNKTSYYTQIDLSGESAYCSCLSQETPCRHALALLQLHKHKGLAARERPAWLVRRLIKRIPQTDPLNDEQYKKLKKYIKDVRRSERFALFTSNLSAIEAWLEEILNVGFNSLAGGKERNRLEWAGHKLFQHTKARQLNNSRPNLHSLHFSEQHPLRALHRISQIQQIVSGFKQFDMLPLKLQADLLTASAWKPNLALMQNTGGIAGTWKVIGLHLGGPKARICLQDSRSQKVIWGGISYTALKVGDVVDAQLTLYPSNYPTRAALQIDDHSTGKQHSLVGQYCMLHDQLSHAIDNYHDALHYLPWLRSLPVMLDKVYLLQNEQRQLSICDSYGMRHACQASPLDFSYYLAVTGGHTCRMTSHYSDDTCTLFDFLTEHHVYKVANPERYDKII